MKKLATIVVFGTVALFVSVALAGDPPAKTCGQMTAEAAAMPAKVAELMTAYAAEAEAHAAFIGAIKGDKNATAEADAMKKLAASYKDSAAALTKTADAMKAAAAWPAVKHDMKAMQADAKVKAAMDKVGGLQKDFGAMVAKMSPAPAAPPPAPPPPAPKK
ncbi:MAG: hypothetical protein A2138_01475 [Deltaproteobacteria bacterium RBG_16_71_12]|nr:MAG: hypothetical protein A2138_01475 [Deltaproteobacteria bacterium RBG_16_71_12]